MRAALTDDGVYLIGSMKDCDDLIKRLVEFASIDGVNRIIVEASCQPK
jgi:hypothetical protein